MVELSIVDMCFALWGGVSTALYFITKHELNNCKRIMIQMLSDLYDGDVELVKTADGKGLTIKEVKK